MFVLYKHKKKVSSNILEQQKHIQSFQNIQTESEQIVNDLKVTLRKIVMKKKNNNNINK